MWYVVKFAREDRVAYVIKGQQRDDSTYAALCHQDITHLVDVVECNYEEVANCIAGSWDPGFSCPWRSIICKQQDDTDLVRCEVIDRRGYVREKFTLPCVQAYRAVQPYYDNCELIPPPSVMNTYQ